MLLVSFALVTPQNNDSHTPPCPADNINTEAGIELGKKLFNDTRLSNANTVSCATCHKKEFGFADTVQFHKGETGMSQPRNTMPLLNLAWNDNFFWEGRVATLEQQVLHPIRNSGEMNQDIHALSAELGNNLEYIALFKKAFDSNNIDSVHIASALSQFVRSLASFHSPMDSLIMQAEIIYQQQKGRRAGKLFSAILKSNPDPLKKALHNRGLNFSDNTISAFVTCIQCHDKEMNGDKPGIKSNGMAIIRKDKGLAGITGLAQDEGKFKVPSLRNIMLTRPYMHDGRMKTMDDVLEYYNHNISGYPNLDSLLQKDGKPIEFNLTDKELEKMKALLHLFTDRDFVTNANY
jgi:cytochrome c peroxidase